MPKRNHSNALAVKLLGANGLAAQQTEFWQQLSNVHFAAFSAIGETGWPADSIASTATDQGSVVVVAQEADNITGFALLRFVADEAELITMAVSPEQAGRGIGQAILLKAIDYARASSAQNFYLEVRSDNKPALGLYKKNGFKITGQRDHYYKMADGSKRDAKILCLAV